MKACAVASASLMTLKPDLYSSLADVTLANNEQLQSKICWKDVERTYNITCKYIFTLLKIIYGRV